MDCLDLWAVKARMALRLERQPSWIELGASLGWPGADRQRRSPGPGLRSVRRLGSWLVTLGRYPEQRRPLQPSAQAGR